jgi:hypothetical protein
VVAQLSEPVQRLEPLLTPITPPDDRHVTYGYRRDKDRKWVLTDAGREAAAVTQRILLRYALDYDSRSELARRYSMCDRNVQDIICGRRTRWFTAPIRERLVANGIGTERMTRSPKGCRVVEVKEALERLASRAQDMILWPESYSWSDRGQVAIDLYLLSGAWRRDEDE